MARRVPLLLLAALLMLPLAGCETEPVEPRGEPGEPMAPPAEVPDADEAAPEEVDEQAAAFAGPIEAAHGLDAWRAQEAVAADVTVTFGGSTALDGRMTFTPDMGRARLDLADGTVVVWDGQGAWVSPESAEMQGARFHVLTWPYFLAAPMKLRDPGTHLEPLGTKELEGKSYDAARLTFGEGVGDSPDDWYVVYRHPETNRVAAMGYIVTYGTPLEQAEAEPHAIVYDDYRQVDGVAVPTTWSFRLWSEEQGVHGDPIGSATLDNVRFVTPEPGTFERPADAREDAKPTA